MKRDDVMRTNPDYVVYTPAPAEEELHDGGNENIVVIPGKDEWVAFWIQSSAEQAHDSRLVRAFSFDEGKNWTRPETILGKDAEPETGKNRICFMTAFQNKCGRIYLMYGRFCGISDPHENGFMCVRYSDDNGKNFSRETVLSCPSIAGYDDCFPGVPPTFLPYMPPQRLSNGTYIGGITRFASVLSYQPRPSWIDEESMISVYIIENADDNPEPENLIISWHGNFSAPDRYNPDWHVGQEPSFIELPNGVVFCVFRTNSGAPWYSLSADGGKSWRAPDALRYGTGKAKILQPLATCPIFDGQNGEYYLFCHNHDGNFGPYTPFDTDRHRRPMYLVRGKFNPCAPQMIDFEAPELLFDNNGVDLGHGSRKRSDLAIYGCMTRVGEKNILWYPDSKYYLCGKIIN